MAALGELTFGALQARFSPGGVADPTSKGPGLLYSALAGGDSYGWWDQGDPTSFQQQRWMASRSRHCRLDAFLCSGGVNRLG